MGATRVLAVVSAKLEAPSGGRSNEGSVTINVEFSPMASPNFEPGRPGEEASELAVILERAIRETGAVDVESLCVLAGRRVWHVRCDVHGKAVQADPRLTPAWTVPGFSACGLDPRLTPG
jgi:exosome complex component RRP45